MNDARNDNPRSLTAAQQELAQLRVQTLEVRATLARLQDEVVQAQRGPADALLEANQELVIRLLRAQDEAQAAAKALHDISHSIGIDDLTNLPNRRQLRSRIEHAIANAKRSGKRVGLLFVDLDHFKEINDELGHAIGDEVLCSIARLLSSITRGGDTVARLGGDEFIILFDQIEDGKILSGIAQKLLGHLQNRLLLGGHQVLVQASLGISLYPEHGDTAESLVQNADKAMYSSKRDGRNRVSLAHHEP